MGAGCSNGRALAVQDSVTKKITLTREGKEHLKNYQQNANLNTSKDGKRNINGQDQSNVGVDGSELNASRVSIERKFPSINHALLWDAVETNDVKSVEELLEKISGEQMQLSEADLYDSMGNSMAHKASSLGHAEILMLLLERTGAKPDIQNAQLATPLHLACKNNRESVAKFLIGCGVDVNGQDEQGQTPLLICCIHGNYELAQIIIESSLAGHTPEPLEIDMRDHRGLTSLNCAAIKGDLKLVKLLIEKGGAKIEEASPKGCTPSIYAARGGYDELLQYLLLVQKASPFKQDNSGATLFHHAIEKGNLNVMKMMLTIGGDISSGIEIADNAGRTPIFEAIENNVSEELLQLLIKKRQKKGAEGGFGAKVNVLNYNGQTPLFSAVREGNMEQIKILIEEAEANADINGGEMIKDEQDEGQAIQEDEFESAEEKNFIEAYKNCMTPLQLACILGQDEIAIYLIERAQANPNLQTNIKGYACLHLAVLANKPEMVIELLTRTNSNPNLPDYSGRTLIEMVEKYIPSYLDNFTSMLENLQLERLKRADNDSAQHLLVATHYYNPDDEREIKGFKDPQQDLEKHIEQLHQQEQQQQMNTDPEDPSGVHGAGANNGKTISQKKFLEMDDAEIEVEEGKQYERDIDNVFGRKIALGLLALNFKFKEIALKIVVKHSEKLLSPETTNDSSFNIVEFVRACTIAVDLTCREKVIKVFNLCLQLLTMLITSPKIEQSPQAIDAFKRVYTERSITLKLLQRSEEGNTRLTNKIHECLLDYSFHPRIGEAHVSSFILQRLNSHNKQNQQTLAAAPQVNKTVTPIIESRNNPADQGAPLGSYKGLLAQLALLYKFVNSFGVIAKKRGSLNAGDIVNAILPSLSHSSQDVRSASTKILLDVQRLSGAVKEEKLASIPEKIRQALIEKVKAQVIEKDQNQANQRRSNDTDQSMDEGAMNSARNNDIEEEEITIGQQNWTGSKNESLKGIQDFLETFPPKKQLPDDFLTNSTVLLKSCLEDNNFNLYLQALEVAATFFKKALFSEIVLGSLQSLIKPIILRTTDTNTRIRKMSVEVINHVWSQQLPQQQSSINGQKSGGQEGPRQDSVSNSIADVLCDSSLQERAIVGRLGLFIKKALSIEAGPEDELSKKSHQVILGRNYEQLTEFACLWALHKNTKVRQNAHKLITEICRMNSIDSRGHPFKQRVVNMIIMLRPSIRDPLIQNINQVCAQANGSEDSGPYINVTELELNLATKQSAKRAASMDVHKQRASLVSRQGTQNSMLPEIGGQRNRPREGNSGGSDLPSVGSGPISLSAAQPTLVLPHSEPLTNELKDKGANLIELFGHELITCFYSQTWSSRFAAIEKVEEQLHNLDPNRRDAMSCEINRKNFPIENNFKTFLEFIEEGAKDPVLKNLIAIFELLKKALPTFFRYIQPSMIKKELMPVVSGLIKKTTDLKAKVREVAIDFCLYLSHQSPIGPEVMVNQVLTELELVLTEGQQAPSSNSSNVAVNMGNSHMISSCFKLLSQFQQQSKILDKTMKTFPSQPQIYSRFFVLINASLRHSNPQVRKEGEALFKTLYLEFGEKLDAQLTNQKQQLVTKILQEAKQEAGLTNAQGSQQQQEYNVQRAQTMIRTELLNQSSLSQVLKGQDEHLQALKLPNPKKRLNAVVELKKAIQKELVQAQAHPQTARNLFEPLSMLIRQLLADDETDIYLETLNMLKAVVSALVPHMSTLDVHLMLGSFIGVIVANTVSGNIRTQIASDKVIIFFAKHNNIGPFVVAKDILKNIEKSIKALSVISKREDQLTALLEKKPTILRFLSILQLLLQHFSIVLCYQPEFYDKCIEIIADSMVLLASEDQSIKNICVQLIVSLQKIDMKLLEQAIQKMDFSRKTPLRKALIELEHQSRAGKNVLHQDHHAFANSQSGSAMANQGGSSAGVQSNMVPASPMGVNRNGNFGETRGSNMTGSSRTSLFSPGTTLRGASPGGPEALGMTTKDWNRNSIENSNYSQPYQPTSIQAMNSTSGSNNAFKNPEGRAMRRMISLENENPRESQTFHNTPQNMTPLQQQAKQSAKQFSSFGPTASQTNDNNVKIYSGNQKEPLVLPEIMMMSGGHSHNNTLTPLGSTTNFNNNQQNRVGGGSIVQQAIGSTKLQINATGGAGFNSSANYGGPSLKAAIATSPPNNDQNQIGGGGIRPPLYVPQKRDGGRTATGMLSGTGIQGLGQPTMINPPQQSFLNRTGPLPASYQPPSLAGGSQDPNQQSQPQAAPQFKTEFNSNLYSGLGAGGTGFSSGASTSGTSTNTVGGVRSNSMQKKPTVIAPIAASAVGSTMFKPQPPQPATISFETNVTRYKEAANNGQNKAGMNGLGGDSQY